MNSHVWLAMRRAAQVALLIQRLRIWRDDIHGKLILSKYEQPNGWIESHSRMIEGSARDPKLWACQGMLIAKHSFCTAGGVIV